jgi:hypothetical protein
MKVCVLCFGLLFYNRIIKQNPESVLPCVRSASACAWRISLIASIKNETVIASKLSLESLWLLLLAS